MSMPFVQAILVADHVYRDQATGKSIVCGIFRGIVIRSKNQSEPDEETTGKRHHINQLREAGSPYAYISITNLRGKKEFLLNYTDLSNNNVLFSTKFDIKSDDPLKNIELSIALPKLPTPHPGGYALELLCENELIGSHRIQAREMRQE